MIAREIAETSKHKVTSLAILKNFSSGKSFAFHEANLKTVGRSCEALDNVKASITLIDKPSRNPLSIRRAIRRKTTSHPDLRRAHSQSGSRRRKLTHVHDFENARAVDSRCLPPI